MSLGRLLLLILFALVAILVCWQPLIYVDDFWMHAAIGRWIVQNHALPHTDPFLWSYTGPWVAHSWLAELGAYALMLIGGEHSGPVLAVLIVEIVVAIEFTIILWPLISRNRFGPFPPLLAAAGLLASVARFSPRPDLFTTLFLIALYRALDSWRANGADSNNRFTRTVSIAVPVLFALWTNLHGAVAIGLVALWACVVADAIQFKFDPQTKRLAIIAGISTLAILINPYGVAYLEIYKPLTNSSFYYIDEWRPLWQPPAIDSRVMVMEISLVVSATVALALNPKRRLAHIAWLLVGAGAMISARRNADICALTSLYIAIANFVPAAESLAVSKPSVLKLARAGNIFCGVFATLWLLQTGLGTLLSQMQARFAIADSRLLQLGQVMELRRIAGPNEHVLNPFDTSKYLEWGLGDQTKLFIDGTNCYPAQTFQDYVDLWSMSPRGQQLFNSLDINVVVGFRTSNSDGLALETYLSTNPDWVKVYAGGPDGDVFAKKSYLDQAHIPEKSRFMEWVY